jgi:hypothetical protein
MEIENKKTKTGGIKMNEPTTLALMLSAISLVLFLVFA